MELVMVVALACGPIPAGSTALAEDGAGFSLKPLATTTRIVTGQHHAIARASRLPGILL